MSSRRGSPRHSLPPTASTRPRSPVPASSTSASLPTRRARSSRRSSTRATRTAPGDDLAGKKINLEFVSANPTGPIHLGGTRWAAVGDALGRILTAQGAEVTREYYFNDHGAQIDRFTRSLIAAALGEPAPEDGYAGAYIVDIADEVLKQRPDVLDLPDDGARRGLPLDRRRADVRPHQADPPRIRCRLRRLLPRELAVRIRSSREGGRDAQGIRQPVLLGRRVVAQEHRLRRRQGSRRHQVRRQRRLHRRRHRLLPEQAVARLRPVHLHARRRPSRLHREAEGRRRRVR